MHQLEDPRFWLSVVLIVALGTAGGALFKYAIGLHGEVTFERIADFRLSTRSIAYLALMAAGAVLITYSGHKLSDSSFAMLSSSRRQYSLR